MLEGLFNDKAILIKERWWYSSVHIWRDTFSKDITPKVNVIVRLEFELAFQDVTVQHVCHFFVIWSVFSVHLNIIFHGQKNL